MVKISGVWCDGRSSVQIDAHLLISSLGRAEISSGTAEPLIEAVAVESLDIQSRLGSAPQVVEFPCGGQFSTLDHAGLASVTQQYFPSPFAGLLYRLESRWHYVMSSLVIVGLLGFWLWAQGIPKASSWVADQLPQQALDRASYETLNLLDKYLKPSELPEQTQARLREQFQPLLDAYPNDRLRVDFRDGRSLGANAFALPSGQIIFTDALVELAEDDRELVAILAHEIGHVHRRHAMRRIVQASVVAVAWAMFVGDGGTVGDIVVILPTMLSEASFSRAMESEADRFSLLLLKQEGIAPVHFVNIMQRLERSRSCSDDANEEGVSENTAAENAAAENAATARSDMTANSGETQVANLPNEQPDGQSSNCAQLAQEDSGIYNLLASYFSMHPMTSERIAQFQ